MNTLHKGEQVVRLGSSKDYCTGRVGRVIELNEFDQRARVEWFMDKDGEFFRPIRTWVKYQFLQPIERGLI